MKFFYPSLTLMTILTFEENSSLRIKPIKEIQTVNDEYLFFEAVGDDKVDIRNYTIKKTIPNFFVNFTKLFIISIIFFSLQYHMTLRFLRLNLTVMNTTIDMCHPNSNSNIAFIRFGLPYFLKHFKTNISCPLQPQSLIFKHEFANLNMSVLPVTQTIRKLKASNVNFTSVFYSMIYQKRVDMMKLAALAKVYFD
jgi:hypothetical protein